MQERTGQVTVFAILGIVILVVLIFALTVSSTLSKMKLQSQAAKAVDDYLESEAINYYVYTCMDTAVTSSIDEIALQGGVFYDYQNGSYDSLTEPMIPYNVTYETNSGQKNISVNVSYGIMNETTCPIVNITPPWYPYPDKYLQDLVELYYDQDIYTEAGLQNCRYDLEKGFPQSGFAGYTKLSRLCYLGSSNAGAIKGNETTSLFFSPCFGNVIKPQNKTIEYQLEQQISRKIKNCVNFSLFLDESGHNITVLNDPVTKVIYNKETLVAETEYNFTVKLKNKEPVLVKKTFKYNSELRITRLHNYVMALAKADNQDFKFNLSKDYMNYPSQPRINPEEYYDPEHMSVKVIVFQAGVPYENDALLIVEDNASRIGNRSLTFLMAIKNRRPALDYIHNAGPESFDILASDNQSIVIDPFGYDPDDGSVTYRYDGWMESYNESCVFVGDNLVCTPDDTVAPQNWSHSESFVETKRKANYTTKAGDMGPHEVIVMIEDRTGLMDFQKVRILVFDLPVARIDNISVYSDIPNNTASIEDPLTLNGTQSTASNLGGGEIDAFNWEIWWHNPNPPGMQIFKESTPGPTITVPYDEYTILNIHQKNLTHVGNHTVQLVVKSVLAHFDNMVVESTPVTQELNVTQCLPHKNDSNKIFPYNNDPSNPTDSFYANHTCCDSDYTAYNNGKTCFGITLYGEFEKLKTQATYNNAKETELTGYEFKGDVIGDPSVSWVNQNDIYEMTFTRKCDGFRGNICGGNIYREFIPALPCGDSQGPDERCLGPAPSGFYGEIKPTECYPYLPENSFEKQFDVGTSDKDGVCNEIPKCSTIGLAGYDSGGPQDCQALCNGGNCNYTKDAVCDCNRTKCGAQCDATHAINWTGKVCQSSCNLASTCKFTQNSLGIENLPCKNPTNPPNQYYAGITNCTVNYYCYYNVKCTASEGPDYDTGDYCKPGEPDPSNPKYCIRQTSACNNAGICTNKHDKTFLPLCPEGQERTCTVTGWSGCQSEE